MIAPDDVTATRQSPLPWLRSSAALAVGRGGAALVSAAWFVVLARLLSPNELGDLALLLSLGAVLGVLGDLGITVLVQERVARGDGDPWSIVMRALRLRIPLTVLSALAAGVAYSIWGHDPVPLVAAVFASSMVSAATYTTVCVALRAGGAARIEAVNDVVSRLVVLGAGTALVAWRPTVLSAIAAYAVADVGSAGVMLRYLSRRRRLDGVGASGFKVRQALPLAIASTLGTLYYRIDIWLLAALASAVEVAQYAVAYRLFEGLMLPVAALSSMTVSAYVSTPASKRRALLRRQLAIGTSITVTVGLALAASAELIVTALFGDEYTGSVSALRVLVVAAALPSVVAEILEQVCAVADRSALVPVAVIALVLNVGLNAFLIPRYGGVGAAVATAVGQMAGAALFFYRLRRALPPSNAATASL